MKTETIVKLNELCTGDITRTSGEVKKMKIGNVEMTAEEYKILIKAMNAIASDLLDHLDSQIGNEIRSRSTLYAGFTGGILGWCDAETNKKFNDTVCKIPFGRQ